MSWLERSLKALDRETRDWPDWKREAASKDPHLGLSPPPTPVPDDPETLAWDDEDLRPCVHCGRRFSEAEIELTQGWCPCCGGKRAAP